MSPSRSTARRLAWAGIAGQGVFLAAWIVAGALEPHYSAVRQYISELGADDAAHPLIVSAAIVVLGLSFVALGVAVVPVLPHRRRALVAALLFAGAGLGLVAAGPFNLDCAIEGSRRCHQLADAGALSWQSDVHLWASFAGEVLLIFTPFALAWALWPAPSGLAALGAGAFGVLVFLVAHAAGGGGGAEEGLTQRIGLIPLHLWAVIVGGGVLYATRGAPTLSDLIPLRPRDFLARSWRGEGELEFWPYALGRRFARPFEVRREATWISDRVWRFDDEVRFADGRVQSRSTFCEFVGDDRVRLTAGDLPDGADVYLEPGGYRMAEFRMAFPIGPVPVYIRVREVSRHQPDGVFANTFEARSLVVGVPLARLRLRVRPLDGEPEPSPVERELVPG